MSRVVRFTRAAGVPAFTFAILLAAGQAAAVPAVTIDNLTGIGLGNPPFTLGFQFTTDGQIQVTGIGIFDSSQDGLTDSHPVGLWDSDGNLLAFGSVASGTANPLIDQFRYALVLPVTLDAGTYRVGALYLTGNDPLIFPGSAINFATAPGITFVGNSFAGGATLSNPTSTDGSQAAYFGANFIFTQVPEPGSLWLVGTGLVAVFMRRRRV